MSQFNSNIVGSKCKLTEFGLSLAITSAEREKAFIET